MTIYTSYYAKINSFAASRKIPESSIFSVSRSQPKGFFYQNLSFLAPSANTLQVYKNSKQYPDDWEVYRNNYRKDLVSNWNQVKPWLDSLSAEKDIYLICWESPKGLVPELKCHRLLILEMIQKHRPDLKTTEIVY